VTIRPVGRRRVAPGDPATELGGAGGLSRAGQRLVDGTETPRGGNPPAPRCAWRRGTARCPRAL